MKRVLWLYNGVWHISPSWIQEVEKKAQVDIEMKAPNEDFSPESFERVFVLADSVSWNRERMLQLAFQKGVNPLKVHLFPWEELQRISPTAVLQIFENFLLETIKKIEPAPARVVKLLPERRVLILPQRDEVLKEALTELGIEVCPVHEPFFIRREGVNFVLYGPSSRETVGAIALLPEWREALSFSIPEEVEETGRIMPLASFQNRFSQKQLRGRTLLFLLSQHGSSLREWEEVFSRSRDLAAQEKAQIWILTEETMVAGASLEKKYREARQEGVFFEKVKLKEIILQPTTDMRRIWAEFNTERDHHHLRIQADWVVYIPSRECLPFPALSWWRGDVPIEAFIDLENPNLLPFSSTVEGVFVFSQFDRDCLPQLAQAIDDYLKQGKMAVTECASVEEEKCVLCLTCLRTCPWKAVEIDGERKRKKARINWEQCHLCGICVAFCPAGAIGINSLHLEDFLFIPYTGGDER